MSGQRRYYATEQALESGEGWELRISSSEPHDTFEAARAQALRESYWDDEAAGERGSDLRFIPTVLALTDAEVERFNESDWVFDDEEGAELAGGLTPLRCWGAREPATTEMLRAFWKASGPPDPGHALAQAIEDLDQFIEGVEPAWRALRALVDAYPLDPETS